MIMIIAIAIIMTILMIAIVMMITVKNEIILVQ